MAMESRAGGARQGAEALGWRQTGVASAEAFDRTDGQKLVKGAAPLAFDPTNEGEAERERELRRQQAAAEAAAREEEAKLRRAQAAVRAQMAKVSALEKSI